MTLVGAPVSQCWYTTSGVPFELCDFKTTQKDQRYKVRITVWNYGPFITAKLRYSTPFNLRGVNFEKTWEKTHEERDRLKSDVTKENYSIFALISSKITQDTKEDRLITLSLTKTLRTNGTLTTVFAPTRYLTGEIRYVNELRQHKKHLKKKHKAQQTQIEQIQNNSKVLDNWISTHLTVEI